MSKSSGAEVLVAFGSFEAIFYSKLLADAYGQWWQDVFRELTADLD